MTRVISVRLHKRRRLARPVRRTWLRRLTIAVVAAIAALVALRLLALYYVDWLWFGEISLRTVFWKRVTYGVVLGPLFGLAFFAIVYGNVEAARRMAPKYRAFEGIDVVEYVHEGASRRVRQVALTVTALVAVLWGFAAARSWLTFARALDGVPFGIKDPVFHHDLSFYVFTLPAWQYLYSFLYGTLLVALVATALVHLALGGIQLQDLPRTEAGSGGSPVVADLVAQIRRVRIQRNVVAHLSGLLAALFILGGVGYLLEGLEPALLARRGWSSARATRISHLRLPHHPRSHGTGLCCSAPR